MFEKRNNSFMKNVAYYFIILVIKIKDFFDGCLRKIKDCRNLVTNEITIHKTAKRRKKNEKSEEKF